MLTKTRTEWLILAALLVGLLARVSFALFYWQDKPLTHDEQEYLIFAENLAAGRGFARELPGVITNPSTEVFSRAPLYPAMLAVLFRVTGQPTDTLPSSAPRVVQVAQSCIGLLTIWIVSRLARRVAGPRAACIAAWLAAVYPPMVWSCAYVLSEAIYSPMILGSAWLAGTAIDRRSNQAVPGDAGRLALAGALGGLAALVRSTALAFIVVVAVWAIARRHVWLSVSLVIGAALVVAPWTIRNFAVHGRLVIVAADGGVTFWTGNHPFAIGEGDMAANPRIKEAHVAFRDNLKSLTPEQREPYIYEAALAYIRQHPVAMLPLIARKFFYTWVPIGPSYTLHSQRYYWATVATYVPLLLMTCMSLPLVVTASAPPRALGLLVFSSVLMGLIFFPQERFRIPVVDPALCVGAAVWLAPRLKRPDRLVGR